jgi:uroporphyrinogen III methyltransferase/synthase
MNEVPPLERRRIAVTRPVAQAGRLVDGLRGLGAAPLSCPTIRIADPPDPAPLRRAVECLEEYDWVVFTSANGVERFWRELESQSRSGLPAETRLAAIGPATAETLEMRGVSPEVVPEEYVAEAVADVLIAVGGLAGRRLLLPRAAGARRVLPERLSAAGAQVDEVIAYESKPDLEGIARLRAAIDAGEVDMVTFTAASTVRHFVETAGTELGRARVAVIGPITARAARMAGLRVDTEAREYTVEGLLQAILEYYSDLQERG